MARHVAHYRDHEGFDESFGDVVAETLARLETLAGDPRANHMIVEGKGQRVGCLFCSPEQGDAARLRLVYLDPAYRGRGIGRALLNHAITTARAAGFARLRVSSFDRHAAACALYRDLGFQESLHPPAHAFGQEMRQIDFELNLRNAD